MKRFVPKPMKKGAEGNLHHMVEKNNLNPNKFSKLKGGGKDSSTSIIQKKAEKNSKEKELKGTTIVDDQVSFKITADEQKAMNAKKSL